MTRVGNVRWVMVDQHTRRSTFQQQKPLPRGKRRRGEACGTIGLGFPILLGERLLISSQILLVPRA